jgi:soluble lytic murein transglycosylase
MPNAPDFAGQQAQRNGQALTQLGQALGDIALDKQNEANQLRVIDVSNQAKERMFDLLNDKDTGALNQKGWNALHRPDGKDLTAEYGDKFKEVTDALAGSLGNDMQRKMFAQQAASMHTQLYGATTQHIAGEFKTYQDSTYDATVATSKREMGIMGMSGVIPPDDEFGNSPLTNATDRIKASIRAKARLAGVSQSQADVIAFNEISNGHLQAIEAAVQRKNINFANTYLKQNTDAMTPADVLRVNGLVNHEVNSQVALTSVQATTQQYASKFQPNDMDRLVGVVAGMESGGKDYAKDGTVITSSAGAKGKMQVLDGTNKNPGFGVTPARDDSLAERARVGRDYLGAMVTKYGRIDQGLAAYNAGPGALDEAMTKAKAAGTPDNWLANLPKETQAYVVKGLKKFGSGAGAAPPPTELEFVQSAIDKLGPNPNSDQVAIVRTAAEHQFGIITKSVKEKGEQILLGARQALLANGGDFAALDAKTKGDVATYGAGSIVELEKFANFIANPPQKTNMAAFNVALSHPEELAAMTESQFLQFQKGNFSAVDQEKVAHWRDDYVNGKTDTSTDGINSKAMTTALGNKLESLGIDRAPKHDDKQGQERVGTIQKFVRDSILAEQKNTDRKMTQADIEKHIDGMFFKDITFRNTVLGIPTGGTTAQNMLSMRVADIPSDSMTLVKNELAQQGVKQPTNDMLLRYYWFKKTKGTL